jgi:hypothetical protein
MYSEWTRALAGPTQVSMGPEVGVVRVLEVPGEAGGVCTIGAPGLVDTDMLTPGPGLAYFSGLEMPETGVWGSMDRGGRERGPPI